MSSLFQSSPDIMDIIFLGNVSPITYALLVGLTLVFVTVFFERMVIYLTKNTIILIASVIVGITYITDPVLGITFITFLKFIAYVMENPREYPKIYKYIYEIL